MVTQCRQLELIRLADNQLTARQHGQSGPLAGPQLGSCASSGHAWRHWAPRHSQEQAGPLGAQPCLGCSSEPPRKSLNSPPLTTQVVSTPTAAIVVMELVSGGDLLSPIERNGPYSERRAQHVFAQIVHAVRHLHASGTGPRPKPKPQPKPQQGPRPSAQLRLTPLA